MRSNPKVRVRFMDAPRYTIRNHPQWATCGDTGYRARRPVLVALCVATAFVVALGGTLALLWLVNR